MMRSLASYLLSVEGHLLVLPCSSDIRFDVFSCLNPLLGSFPFYYVKLGARIPFLRYCAIPTSEEIVLACSSSASTLLLLAGGFSSGRLAIREDFFLREMSENTSLV
jgi:hypothetical protein